MIREPLIEIKSVSKVFALRHADKEHEQVQALDAVSLQVMPGEIVGISGPNGSGKSTLLRILAGITKPSSGEIIIRGKVAAILDIGAGFHPELTGRENVLLNGQLLGFSKKEIREKFESIHAFSGIGHFIDEPVKNYSNGMYLRLAFSIVIHLDCDILLLDEVLAVGDHEFMKKCMEAIQRKKESGITALIVSHNRELLTYLCTRQVRIQGSKLEDSGPSFFDKKSGYEADDKVQLVSVTSGVSNGQMVFTVELDQCHDYETLDVGLAFDFDEQIHSRFIISSVHRRNVVNPASRPGVRNTFTTAIPLEQIKPGKYMLSVYVIKNREGISRNFANCHSCEVPVSGMEDYFLGFYPNPLRLYTDWDQHTS